MSKKLFDEDSDEEVSFKTENQYAKKYDAWRGKEELHKLEQKYGSKALTSDASTDSEDDDEPPEVSEETETQFLKTLALLKIKDPRIYDPQYKCFDEKEVKETEKKPETKTLTFDDSDDDDDDGEIFKVEKKAEILTHKGQDSQGAKEKKDGKLKDFLTGKAEHIDNEVEKDLAPLKALWSDPKLNEGEAFLRDYILNKRYLEEGDVDDQKLRDDEELEEDEKRVEEQGQFERAYNFRFEEPDQEFLKRFPRTMNFIRPKDDRRSRKRAEVRERKEEEKRRKMEEIARLKALKLKEIQEKIERIKEVTGNQELAFKEEDIEGDFDPEEHDRRMRALFDEEYYGEADQEKPVFPDLDEELEIENWDKYEKENTREQTEEGPHCEDEGFNMDADYDPKQARATLLEQIQETLGKKRRNRKRKSKLAQLLTQDKPKFVPAADKTYEQYMEEYYKMDCEDVIGGDLPTRFKYREVVPNDYGLTVEEILLADDKELTQWVPLKRIVKHRPDTQEKGEVNAYRQKAQDIRLKKKILPSLFKDLPEEPEILVPLEETTKKKKKKKKNKEKNTAEETIIEQDSVHYAERDNDMAVNKEERKRKKKKHSEESEIVVEANNIEDTNESPEITPKKKKKKKHKDNNIEDNTETPEVISKEVAISKKEKEEINEVENNLDSQLIAQNGDMTNKERKKKKKHKSDGFVVENVQRQDPSQRGGKSLITDKPKKQNLQNKKNKNKDKSKNFKQKFKAKEKFNKNKQGNDKADNPLSKLSDERLKAYGLNPKKYRSFLKYKKF